MFIGDLSAACFGAFHLNSASISLIRLNSR